MGQADIFISYRRFNSSFVARSIFMYLHGRKHDVFMDVETLNQGQFGTTLLNEIAKRQNFILILLPKSLDRCVNPDDWLRREIIQAIVFNRNIIPIFVDGFSFNDMPLALKNTEIALLQSYNAISVPHDLFSAAMIKLESRFLQNTQPQQKKSKIVDYVIEQVTNDVNTTKSNMSALDYFHRAQCRSLDDAQGRIADYTLAIKLDPSLAEAYARRGTNLLYKGDIEGAFSDYADAIRIAPQQPMAYFNRGIAYLDRYHYDAAILDFKRLIEINVNDAFAYFYLAKCHLGLNQRDIAIKLLDVTIHINPQLIEAQELNGLLNYEEKLWIQAKFYLTNAVLLGSVNPNIYFTLGYSFERLSNKKEARKNYKLALSYSPNHQPAKDGLKRVKKGWF